MTEYLILAINPIKRKICPDKYSRHEFELIKTQSINPTVAQSFLANNSLYIASCRA